MASRPVLLAGGLLLGLMAARDLESASQSQPPNVPAESVARRLEPGKPAIRDIEAGQVHTYDVVLVEGQYAHLVVDQRGIDLIVTISGPDARPVTESDSLNAAYGPEDISLIADQTGSYRIEIRSLENEVIAGQYQALLADLRAPDEKDAVRAAAQKAITEAEQLRKDETAESYRRALRKYEKALELRRSLGSPELEALTLANVGEINGLLGDKRLRARYYELAVDRLRTVGNRGELAVMLLNAGVAYDISGNSQRALLTLGESLSILRSMAEHTIEANVLAAIGIAYFRLGEVEKAIDYYNQCLILFRKRAHQRSVANTLHNLAIAYHALGDERKALDYLKEALPLRRAAGDRTGEGATLDGLGRVYNALKEREKALDYYNQALSLRRSMGDQSGQADTLGRIGLVYAGFGERQKALDYYNLALAIQQRLDDGPGEVSSLTAIGRVEKDRGDLTEAQKHLEAALAIVDRLRSKVSDRDLRASYTSSVREVSEQYLDLLMTLHRREPSESFDAEALKANESARGRVLREILEGARQDSGAEGEGRTPDLAPLQSLGVKEIQGLVLDGEALLLEYALGEERSYVWAVTSDSMRAYELPRKAEVEAATRRVCELLTARSRRVRFESAEGRRSRIATADAEYPNAVSALSRMLLSPVADNLKTRRILIVADGALQYLPFAALTVRSGAGEAAPLVAAHEIVVLPSAFVLAVLRHQLAGRAPPKKTLAVIADPVFSADDERVTHETGRKAPDSKRLPDSLLVRSAQELGLEEGGKLLIPRLPFTRNEARAIVGLASPGSSREALDFEANLAVATSAEIGDYRFVHFATHGFLNSRHPELSGLIFSLVGRDGKEQEGFLPAPEVFNLKLPVDLVVLSGCRTGLGKDMKGEGLIGLTRGFMYAGAASVVVSLWDVDDEATAELMTRFYQGMLGKQRRTPAAALRAAQLSISRERRWQFPYYWAAFVLQGEPK